MAERLSHWKWLLLLSACWLPASSAFGQEKQPKLAVFRLSGEVSEQPKGDDLLFGSVGGVALKDLVERIDKAKTDDEVKGIVLLLNEISVGRAQTEEILQALNSFRESGKKVHAHTGSTSTGSFLLLTAADTIAMTPTADLWLVGFYGESPYLRGLLDKIGVVPDYLTCGDYKSAAEMFMLKGPSPEAEKMQNWLLDSIYQTTLDLIAKGRKTSPDKVREWINNGPYSAEKAKELGIIDAVATLEQFEEGLRKEYGEKAEFDRKYGKKKQQEMDLSNPFAVLRIWSELLQGAKPKKDEKDAIGIVYVEGPIVEGSAQQSPFGSSGVAFSSAIRKALHDAAEDDSIKGVVLRVNSPGGSAVASEIILQATRRVKEKKPIVVSMGDVAGSGGYYVTCASDAIFADRFTITGSIGVVAGKFATTQAWDKIGVTFKSYRRGDNAGILSSERPFSDEEREKIRSWMEEIYGVFKGHVVKIRGEKLKKDIDELAGGRVYTGEQALELGLVDKIGTLTDAVKFVADKAGVKEYEIRIVPKPKNFLETLLEDIVDDNGDSDSLIRMAKRAGSAQTSVLDAVLPMIGQVDSGRLAAVKSALMCLELLQRDRVALMTPQITIAP